MQHVANIKCELRQITFLLYSEIIIRNNVVTTGHLSRVNPFDLKHYCAAVIFNKCKTDMFETLLTILRSSQDATP